MGGQGVSDRIEVAAHTRNLARVREFVRATIGRAMLPPRECGRVVLAVDEAVANTMLHGYGGAMQGRVEVLVDVDNQCVRVTISDSGTRFDAARRADSTLTLDLRRHIESGARKGLGLFIMRKVMDEIRYTSRSGRVNQLTLVKYLSET